MMRRILIDHARGHLREKRGGGQQAVRIDEVLVFSNEQSLELVKLDESLERLTKLDARQGKVVELRFFGGLTVEETARVLGIQPTTLNREYTTATASLHS